MSTELQARAAEAAAKMKDQNPANAPAKPVAERKRIPLSVPERKLEVPPLPGYYLRWIRGTPQRLAQAERAGYEFVRADEIELNNVSLGGDASKTGNTDLGSQVSVVDGSETDGGGQAVRLYLMKQKMEFYLEDQARTQARNDSVADALTAAYKTGHIGGQVPGEERSDVQNRYVDMKRTRVPDLFRRKAGGK